MANNHDIRVWARENGIEVSDSGPLSAEVKEAYAAYETGQGPDADPVSAMRQAVDDEVAPVIKKEGVGDRVRRHWKERDQAPPRAASRSGRAPARGQRSKTRPPRVSIERMLSRGWDMLGSLTGNILPATGKMMEIQAPVAGMLLEETVKDTIVDRALQPVARAEQSLGVLSTLLGPTLFVAMMELRPDKAHLLLPELRKQLMGYIEMAGPRMEVVMRRQVEMEEKYGQEIDEILVTLFAMVAPSEEASQ